MARKAKTGARKATLNLKQVWTDLQMEAWLSELCEMKPEGRWIRKGDSIKGHCPWHADPSPSFVVSPRSGIAKCFGCDLTWLHPVKFIASVRESTFSDALVHLRKVHKLKAAIPDSVYQKAQAWEIHQKYKSMLADLFCSQLLIGMTAHPDYKDNLWMKTTVLELMRRQMGVSAPTELRAAGADQIVCEADPAGVWAGITSNQLVGILPPMSVVENYFNTLEDKDGFEFFRKYFAQYFDQKYVGAIVFIYHDEPGSVARFKLRVPIEEKDMKWVDDEYGEEMGDFRGFFGLNYYRTYVGGKREEGSRTKINNIIANIHEGEFDALASIARQIRDTSDDFMALAVGGASAQPLERLNLYGITRARLIGDNDAGGQKFVEINLQRSNTEKIELAVFQWPDEYLNWRDPNDPQKRIKDPDEAVKTLGYPKWSRYIRTEDCFQELHLWVFERAAADLSHIHADRVSERFRIAASWGRHIKNTTACGKYCDAMAVNFDMDRTNLYRDVQSRDENEEAFVRRLALVFTEHFYLIGIENGENRKRILHVWHKDTRKADTIVLGDERAVQPFLMRYFGTIYDFVRNQVGDPAFLTGEGDDAELSIEFRTLKYRSYMNHALAHLSQGLPQVDDTARRSQGIHYISSKHGDMRSYLVNGNDVYKLEHSDDMMKATLLAGPSDEGLLFDGAETPWLTSVTKAEDLIVDVNLVDLFSTLREMVGIGWAWRAHGVDPTFLGAYSMCLPVMSVFSRQTAIMLNAEAQSGKSRFVSGFIGGTGFPSIHMVPSAKALQIYSAAAIRSQWNNCALTLCLEEFEDSGGLDKKAVTVRNVLELTRDLISENFVDVSIGTASGGSRKYKLRFPMVCAAIKPLRDAASLSRFIVFELTKDDRRIDPVIALTERWGEEGLALVRHQVATGLLKHMPRLRQLQREIEKEFASGASLPNHVPSRFREALFPILAMLKLVAEQPGGAEVVDYKQFAWDFCESRREALTRLKTTSENETLFESVLSSMFQINSDANISHVTNVRSMLVNQNQLDDINKTHKGVFFDAANEWLLVHWIEASQGVLANTKYRGEAPTLLKQVSERSPYYVKTEDAKAARVLERMVDVMGPGHKYDLITIYNVKHLLDETRQGRANSKQLPARAPQKPKEEQTLKDVSDAPVKLDEDMIT